MCKDKTNVNVASIELHYLAIREAYIDCKIGRKGTIYKPIIYQNYGNDLAYRYFRFSYQSIIIWSYKIKNH